MNSYSLQNLYNKGILDYVPMELVNVTPVSVMTPMQNPYLGLAQAGGLYQSSINGQDNFQSSANVGINSVQNNGYAQNSNNNYSASSASRQDFYNQNGINNDFSINNSNAQNSTENQKSNFISNFSSLFKKNNNASNTQDNSLMNGINNSMSNINPQNKQNEFSDITSFKDGIYNTANKINNTSAFVKGLASGAIILGTLIFCFKKGNKTKNVVIQENNSSFWSKLNIFKHLKKK